MTSKAMTRGVHHVGLTVVDIQQTASFFSEALGFAQVGERPNYPAVFLSDGTVMLTVDLARMREKVRDPCDTATANRVATLMASDPRVRRRVERLARVEAQRLAGGRLGALDIDITVRARGTKVFIDADLQTRDS